MKRANIWKGKLGWQSEFDHLFACWANNHNGWAKAKKYNKRVAKRRLKQEWKKEDQNHEYRNYENQRGLGRSTH